MFVVIDPYWYTTTKPFTGNTGGGETSDTGSGNRWDWTLGQTQFNWLKTTLQNSTANYKFIFAHHMTGGSDDYVRGGANPAHIAEWGGYNEAGSTYEWATKRPGWGSDPVHQILVDNNVSAFFHGHDHQYGYESRDGVVYQALPAAGFSGNGFSIYSTGSGYTIQALPSPGHLRVAVNPAQATVDYVKTTDGTVTYSYSIPSGVPTYDLTTAVSPAGGGTINPAAGEHTYAENTVVNITAAPAAGYAFANWSGACSGSGACQVTMDADKSVTANFTAATYDLTVASDPVAGGTTNPTAGVHTYAENTVVNITAAPAAGYAFANWSGACSGSGACQVTMDADKSVTANFTLVTYDLTVAVSPAGGGTTNPAAGMHTYAEGAVVDITAAPAAGYAFANWSGACSGSGACQVTMNTDKSVTANFTAATHDLTVTSDPVAGGTTNPAAGVHTYAEGAVVDITAAPAAGYAFANWSGACSGSGACQVTMNADKSVTAHFSLVTAPEHQYHFSTG